MPDLSREFLTTRELAELLHIKERKVYDLASAGEVPCSRVTGKLLFPRREIEAWLARHSSGGDAAAPRPQPAKVVLGSQDPLLSWALGASGADLATLAEGSLDGLARFAAGEGVATGLHIYAPEADSWNVAAVRPRFELEPVALVEFAWRERGLIVAAGNEGDFETVAALPGLRVVPRQEATGSQALLRHMLRRAGVDPDRIDWMEAARTESELGIAILEGKADVGFGLRTIASQLRLGFVPLVRERFDLLVDRRSWFEPPLQQLFEFFRSDSFRARARELGGYDISGLGTVHFNGA
ncbi:MAG: helix-turn-helix transcriptional regulator [Wenzhouxiangellaceae bacterium]|nr:helix-turn-helix transcriptional regulator [Wenzhouxiangellaceae bacterium]